MSELKKLLLEYVNSPKRAYNKQDYMGNRGYIKKEYSSWDKLNPMTYDEMKTYRTVNNMKSTFSHVSPSLYNKKIKIDEFELIIQHKSEFVPDKENDKKKANSSGYAYINFNWDIQCNIILVYHGIYTKIAQYSDSMYYNVKYVYPNQTNWSWLKFGPEKPYMLGEDTSYLQFDEYAGTKAILEAIDIDEALFENNDVEFQSWWTHQNTLKKYTAKHIDTEWFISSETKDGVYKPEPQTIRDIIHPYGKHFKKDSLVKLDVNTIQLRTNAHYPIASYFDIPKDCKIKAAKSIIKTYGYEKYCIDDNLVEEIKKDKKVAKAKQASIDYKNQFTLMQHGKVIMDNKDKFYIIQYLEEFMAKDVDSTIIETIQPLFDKFEIETFYLGYWGTYDKYELRGKKCEFNEDVYSLNAKKIKESVITEIYELHSDLIPTLEDREVELAYGWPENIELLGVRKNKRGKLETFTSTYDLM